MYSQNFKVVFGRFVVEEPKKKKRFRQMLG